MEERSSFHSNNRRVARIQRGELKAGLFKGAVVGSKVEAAALGATGDILGQEQIVPGLCVGWQLPDFFQDLAPSLVVTGHHQVVYSFEKAELSVLFMDCSWEVAN